NICAFQSFCLLNRSDHLPLRLRPRDRRPISGGGARSPAQIIAIAAEVLSCRGDRAPIHERIERMQVLSSTRKILKSLPFELGLGEPDARPYLHGRSSAIEPFTSDSSLPICERRDTCSLIMV